MAKASKLEKPSVKADTDGALTNVSNESKSLKKRKRTDNSSSEKKSKKLSNQLSCETQKECEVLNDSKTGMDMAGNVADLSATAAKKIKKQKSQKRFNDAQNELINGAPESSANVAAIVNNQKDGMPDPKRKRSRKNKPVWEDDVRTIFVGNLPVGIVRKDLLQLFSQFGSIDSVRFRSLIPAKETMSKRVAAIKNAISESSKHGVNAYIKFVKSHDAEKALSMNGHVIGNHRMQVDSCTRDPKYDNKRTIFVGNLPFASKDDDLFKHFSDCGEIDRIRIIRDKNTGVGKGFGLILFKESISVEMALKLNGEKFDGRPLRISRAVKKAKQGKFSKKPKQNGTTVEKKATKEKSADSSNPTSDKKRPKHTVQRKKIKKSFME